MTDIDLCNGKENYSNNSDLAGGSVDETKTVLTQFINPVS